MPDLGHGYQQVLVAAGWTVLTLNPRASDGYGEAFYAGNAGRWGLGDQEDFLDPVRELIADGTADPGRHRRHRLLLRRLHDVLAHRTLRPVRRRHPRRGSRRHRERDRLRRWVSRSWRRNWAATPWDDRALLAAQSPYESVGKVTAPTLVLHGGADDRCPTTQAEQWFAALRARGVPTEMVLYPGGSHLFILERPARPPARLLRTHHRLARPVRRRKGLTNMTDTMEDTEVAAEGDHSISDTATTRIDAAYWRGRLAELIVKYKVPGAALGILREGAITDMAAGVLSVVTGYRATPDSHLPDRLHLQGVDRHTDHATGRRGQARPRRAGARGVAGLRRRRPGRVRGGHCPAPADPHQRHRRGRVHRHRPWRRLHLLVCGDARRGSSKPSAGHHLLLLQLRIRHARRRSSRSSPG